MNINQINVLNRATSAGLALAIGFSVASCGAISEMTRTITPNAYSESVGPAQVKADENECFQYGMAEKRRLLEELKAGDPAMVADQNRESGAKYVARDMAKMEGASSAEADLAAGVAGFFLSSWDANTYDESQLAHYLGIEGGLGAGLEATQRLKYTCLRKKGYRVEDHEKDGTGMAYIAWADPEGITRAMLREEDGTERVFYEYVTPSKQ